MQLFYSPDIANDTTEYTFPREESKHIVRVLRKKEGDLVHLTDGLGYLYTGRISLANPNKCKAQISEIKYQKPTSYKLHMAVAPTKNNDRFEWFLEKATEIGIHEITPILCEHSERKTIKEERLNKILQSAMKQSLQTHLPKLNPLISFESFMSQQTSSGQQKCIAHCEEGEKKSLKKTIVAENDVLILIGPEGDFSKKEISIAMENKYIAITLGSNRLRTETAALSACQMIAFVNEI